MNYKSKNPVFFLTIFFLLAAFIPIYAQEPTGYRPLAPLPGTTINPGSSTSTAKTYIEGLFTLIIALAGVLAVVMIIFGGIKYMSTDAFGEKSEAKTTIQNAIWGLLLVIGAWLILFTVNPNLVSFNLSIPVQPIPVTPPAPGSGSGAGRPMTEAEITADRVVRDRLVDADVRINAGPCLLGQGYGCTNLNGLPESTISGLITLKDDCGCRIRVSGGTEPGPHATHGVGHAAVDLSDEQTLRTWLTANRYLPANGTRAVVPLSGGGSATFTFERVGQGRSTGDHWHVQM